MKKSLIALAVLAMAGSSAKQPARHRARTHDVAYTYRMPAGFPGDVNRTHPASIAPAMLDATNPPASYGVPVLFDLTHSTIRGVIAADASDSTPINISGVLVRPYPVQAGTSAGANGQQLLTDATAPLLDRPGDYLEDGYIMVQVRGTGTTSLSIDADVYIWAAASTTGHVLGGFETAASMGNTVKVANAKFRGATDANGVGELRIFPAVSA